jgi:Calcium-dependent channel, 7TM region, putative phosphate
LQALAAIKINGNIPFKFLSPVREWNTTVIGLVEGLAPPIIQSLFLALIPVFIRLLVSISRNVSFARVDSLVRNWYFFFLFLNGFVFTILGGAILQSLPALIKVVTDVDWREAANILAVAVPSQGYAALVQFALHSYLSWFSHSPTNIDSIRLLPQHLLYDLCYAESLVRNAQTALANSPSCYSLDFEKVSLPNST